jgi:hypothetical protein
LRSVVSASIDCRRADGFHRANKLLLSVNSAINN